MFCVTFLKTEGPESLLWFQDDVVVEAISRETTQTLVPVEYFMRAAQRKRGEKKKDQTFKG